MKVYTGTFTATASTSGTETFATQPGDYPVLAQYFPAVSGGSLAGLYLTQQANGDSWTGNPVLLVSWNNTTDGDIDVSYYVLISDEPTSYVTYQGP
jgi:hypothetical protein